MMPFRQLFIQLLLLINLFVFYCGERTLEEELLKIDLVRWLDAAFQVYRFVSLQVFILDFQ